MASVLLTRDILAQESLPPICMRCGAPATTVSRQRLALHSRWILLLAIAIGPFAPLFYEWFATRITLPAPMCFQHQHHWFKRRVFSIIMSIAYIWLVAGAIAFETWLRPRRWGDVFGFSSMGLLAFWVLALLTLENWIIAPTNMGPRGVTLGNVHPSFRDAVLSATREPVAD